MAKMVQISDDILAKALGLLSSLVYHQTVSALKASKPELENKFWAKVHETQAVMDDITAALDPKE